MKLNKRKAKKKIIAHDLFGKLPNWNKSTQQIKDEIREGWKSDEDKDKP